MRNARVTHEGAYTEEHIDIFIIYSVEVNMREKHVNSANFTRRSTTQRLFVRINENRLELVYAFVVFYCCICVMISGLRCFTCTYLQEYSDKTCLIDANSTRITDCSKKYCTIMRQESVRPSGIVISFLRDCLDKPLYLNAVKTDATFKTFYRSCTTDLCNDSDGTTSATNINPNLGATENMELQSA
ncbi:uncharacterized protein [Bactrocera oleae]|uniref:uncharacterized protein isoform X2 n=1 Tax=Bactrocera oleae TaxID=104688 RepID=UPI00387E3FA3